MMNIFLKPSKFQRGDKIAVVSLSNGLLGEQMAAHELKLAKKRLLEVGLTPVMMPNALKGIRYIAQHPEARADDLKAAYMDNEVKGIISAIGGNDTYKLYPFLFEDSVFMRHVVHNPKIFIGFSDSTMNHLFFYKSGIVSFYGPSLLADFAELGENMLNYTKENFLNLFSGACPYDILSSQVWYEERTSYAKDQIGSERICHQELHGYETITGEGVFTGKLWGGCIETLYDALTGSTYPENKDICQKYDIFPKTHEWENIVLFLETSEAKSSPQKLKIMLTEFQSRGILSSVKCVLVGKPVDESFYEEYKKVYSEIFSNASTPALYNINFGHSAPRCILPYGVAAEVDMKDKTIKIVEDYLT